MASSLITALSGLKTHQQWLDVVGNNLANSNTPGFKAGTVLFGQIFSRTLRAATGGSSSAGGRNPLQLGLGVQLAQVNKNQRQGALNLTGRAFDVAIGGEGYFALFDGARSVYTRVGTFGLDNNSNFVDLRTGFKVLSPLGTDLKVDTAAIFPPKKTDNVVFSGNLPAEVTGPKAAELKTAAPFVEGTPAVLTSTSSEPFTVTANTTFTMQVSVGGGAPATVSITDADGSVTAAELVTAINAQVNGITASVGAGGEVVLTTELVGEDASISVTAGASGSDLAGAIGLSTLPVTGNDLVATSATDLNDLTANLTDYQNGDTITISGTESDGTPVQANFVYGTDGTTLADLVAFANAAFASATVSFDAATQEISITASDAGESDLSLVITDGEGQAGATNWAQHAFTVNIAGVGPDTVATSIEVFDAAGVGHVLTYSFERQDDGDWQATVSLAEGDGVVTGGVIDNIQFSDDGALLTPPSVNLDVTFAGQARQTLTLQFGSVGAIDGLTQFGGSGSVVVDSQDGYGAGNLGSVVVTKEGEIQGFYTNGQSQILGAIGVAVFSNPGGLEEIADGFLAETGNSGQPILTAGARNGAGDVVSGALEQSNVDTAEEFVNLIEAQRGFQANARVITTQNEVLAETVNLI